MQTRAVVTVVISMVLLGATPVSAQTLILRAGHDQHGASRAELATQVNTTAFENIRFSYVLQSPLNGRSTSEPDRGPVASHLSSYGESTPPGSFDLDLALEQAATMGLSMKAGLMTQAGASGTRSGSPVLMWVGVGLMALGGIYGADGFDCASAIGFDNSLCVRRFAVGGALLGGGMYLFFQNR